MAVQALIGSGPFVRHRRQPLDKEDWVKGAVQIYLDITLIHFVLSQVPFWLNFEGKPKG